MLLVMICLASSDVSEPLVQEEDLVQHKKDSKDLKKTLKKLMGQASATEMDTPSDLPLSTHSEYPGQI